MDDTLLALLRRVDTPTVCNAIEVVEGKRGFDRFTRGTMLCSAPAAGAIVDMRAPRGSPHSPHQASPPM